MNKAAIEKLAAEEIILEAKKGALRASVSGPSGWQKCPLPKTNKRFLRNTILSSLASNKPRPVRKPAESTTIASSSKQKLDDRKDDHQRQVVEKPGPSKRKLQNSDLKKDGHTIPEFPCSAPPGVGATEGGGVGRAVKEQVGNNTTKKISEAELIEAAETLDSIRLTFHTNVSPDTGCAWEGVLWQHRLYLQVPSVFHPSGSRQSFIAILEYGEEVLKASQVIICMRKDRSERAALMRAFMFLGFSVLPPTSPWIPDRADATNVYMVSSNE